MINIINKIVTEKKLDVSLVLAIIDIESSFNPFKIRYEHKFRFRFRVLEFAKGCGVSPTTESILQSCSWGLMQVMGCVARELGFSGILTELVDVEKNVNLGCAKLSQLDKKYSNLDDIIAAYNAGSPKRKGDQYFNQAYVNSVRRRYNDRIKI